MPFILLFKKNTMSTYSITKNEAQKRYEMTVGDKVAYIEYIQTPDKIFLTHTEVPQGLEGQGIGSSIVSLVLEAVKTTGLPLMPLCPFVAAYIRKHPEWKEILAPNIRI